MAPKCAFGEGCHRTIAYKPDADLTVVEASRYCDKHTCAGFAGEPPCFKKVIRTGETRCITHVQCRALFCEEPRLPAANGGWWDCCSTHKCEETGCMILKQYQIAKERYFKFCPKHKCVRPECENGKTARRNHCAAHNCTVENCAGMVEDEEKLCPFHLQCQSPSCARKRAFRGGNYQTFCSQHLTCDASNCIEDKRNNSLYCDNHTCYKRDCNQASATSFYCTSHTCEVIDCQNARVYYLDNSSSAGKSHFCPIHECRKGGCHKASRGTFGYCREHACDRTDCKNLKMIDPDSNPPLLLCRKHYDESRNPEAPGTPPSTPLQAPVPAPAPAPAPAPLKMDPDMERKLDVMKREQREQRDKLDDIMDFLKRRL